MIIDGRSADDGLPLDYDLLIVGGGPAGLTLSNEFDGTGRSVGLLESGGLEFDPQAQALNEGLVTGLETIDLAAARLRLLGGTSHHWGGFCLPLDPVDFERAPLSGMTGWPFPRSELLEHYPRACVYCDLGRFDFSLEAARGLGADDLLLPGDDLVETSALRLSANPPTNFGDKFAGMLRASPNVHAWLWTNLVGLEISPEGVVEGVRTRTLSGVERRMTARRVVLACGAVENTRLLMVANDLNGTSFGNASGLLGACYMDHLSGGAAFLWPRDPLGPKVYWDGDAVSGDGIPMKFVWRVRDEVQAREGLANAQFYLIPFSTDTAARRREGEAKRGLDALKSIAKWTLGRGGNGFSLSESYCSFIANADAMLAEAVDIGGERVDRVLLKYEAEQQPTRASYVELSYELDAIGLPRPHLHWSPTEADKESIIRTAMLIGQACGRADLGRLELEEGTGERYWNMVTAWHQLGTTRMSEAPADGVVDPDCRVHGTRNLYVAGGSVFPSEGRANPTLTIVALAVRLADHLKAGRE
jgi:choline dehydrogenase-like flavoprotein